MNVMKTTTTTTTKTLFRCLLLASILGVTNGWSTFGSKARSETELAFLQGASPEEAAVARHEPVIVHTDTDEAERFWADAHVEWTMMNTVKNDHPFVGPPFDLEGRRTTTPHAASARMRTPRESHFLFTAMDSSKKLIVQKKDEDECMGRWSAWD
ncbi:expressed unknown protein [Seminavis robusta]|uniref:Uncharacterized protein n=1 Tax=Seminavis robusta TaxID=568900 RepID=A0A9N8HVM5_9STRA|nr:expressed unknown protein [Seminavis robusta]|eukprot:Sro1972_g308620.1 n/a (155) ;mRNA; f:3575-4039